MSKVSDTNEVEFEAGRLRHFGEEWKQLTSDPFILQLVHGAKIPITQLPLIEDTVRPNEIPGFLVNEADLEIQKMLSMGVIEQSEHEENEVISPIFLVEKPDGSHRVILNLKKFNECIEYEHFKMEQLSAATQLMKKNCKMASVDLRHAYYSVNVDPQDRKYLKFYWRGQLFAYTCLPNGLANCPRYFTKLMKPVFASLRSLGLLSAAYIDDSYLQGQNEEECQENIDKTVELLTFLGFTVHKKKSVLTPTTKLKYLGFILNSEEMTVSISPEKAVKIKENCQHLIEKQKFSIRDLARVIGQIVACFPGTKYGPLFYRKLEKQKTLALKQAAGNYEAKTSLTNEAKKELEWWIKNAGIDVFPLLNEKAVVHMETDASLKGWGAVCENEKTGGRWKKTEMEMHINALELLAIEFALLSFSNIVKNKHVKILCDNTCAVTYIRNMGGSKSEMCNDIAHRIWVWCQMKQVDITITHIAGAKNIDADEKSRNFNDAPEWMLNPNIFEKLVQKTFLPEIDLFATRLNHQVPKFVSWKPDPEAMAIDAFSIKWNVWDKVYLFPPFSMIQRALQKLYNDEAEALFILPNWPTAVWYPQMMRMLIRQPIKIPKSQRTLVLPQKQEVHPLHRQLQLLAVHLSGKPYLNKVFVDRQQNYCAPLGETQQRNNMPHILRSGNSFVLKGHIIHFTQL